MSTPDYRAAAAGALLELTAASDTGSATRRL